MQIYKKQEKNGVEFLISPLFHQLGLQHAFSTRNGGVSSGCFSSMNLSLSSADSYENVFENHMRFAKAVGYQPEQIVLTNQVHKTEIRNVTREDQGKGLFRETDILETDGLITNEKELPLMIFFADCVPLLFADIKKGVIGAAHSGWRGTVGKIGAKMVEKMVHEYGCKRENIFITIGPSICQNCYEVSSDVACEFLHSFDLKFHKHLIEDKGMGKYQLDLWMANRILLLESGISTSNVETAGICTCCNSQKLFSHRATGGRRGTMAGVITL